MQAKDKADASPRRPDGVCVWCKERFDGVADRTLHVSKLGAPGEFHQACFEEYERSTQP